jgi:hypothetical protein
MNVAQFYAKWVVDNKMLNDENEGFDRCHMIHFAASWDVYQLTRQKVDTLDDENSEISKIGYEIARMPYEEFEANLKKLESIFKKPKSN